MNDKETTNPIFGVQDHGDYLFPFAFVRLCNYTTAKNAAQKTLLAGIKTLDVRFDREILVRYWLRGIFRHKVADYIRKASHEIAMPDQKFIARFKFKTFGISSIEIGNELNLKTNHLWTVLHRAKKQLKSYPETNWTRKFWRMR